MDVESACPEHGVLMDLPSGTAFRCRDGVVRVTIKAKGDKAP